MIEVLLRKRRLKIIRVCLLFALFSAFGGVGLFNSWFSSSDYAENVEGASSKNISVVVGDFLLDFEKFEVKKYGDINVKITPSESESSTSILNITIGSQRFPNLEQSTSTDSLNSLKSTTTFKTFIQQSNIYKRKALPLLTFSDKRQRLPVCLIVGVRKAGTRALLEYLSLHPSVVVSSKETHFFDSDQNYAKGLPWYLSFMPPSLPDQITVEKTPAYFLSYKVPRRIQNAFTSSVSRSMKFLLVVKNPIERALSDYAKVRTSKKKLGIQYSTFEELSTDPITGRLTSAYRPIRRSLYSLQLKNWLRYFRIDQFHFVSGESLIKDPASELEGVERFLGVRRFLTSEKFLWNETRGFYCMVTKHDLSKQGSATKKHSTKTSPVADSASSMATRNHHRSTTVAGTANRNLLKVKLAIDFTTRKLNNNRQRLPQKQITYNLATKCAGEETNDPDQEWPESLPIKCLSSSKGVKHPKLEKAFLEKLKQFFEPYNEEFYKMTGIHFGW